MRKDRQQLPDVDLSSNRLAMAQEQAELIKALLCNAPHPQGFDSERLQEASLALVRKRIRCIQRANPLVEAICPADNDSILMQLHRFVRENPTPHPRGPYFDSLDFLAYVGLKSAAKPKIQDNWKSSLVNKLRSFRRN
ncbi:hypothetical protein BH11CYA1_BH11CYA1_17570 [soil metagenome]